jgi:hypothetical protein
MNERHTEKAPCVSKNSDGKLTANVQRVFGVAVLNSENRTPAAED